jgi:hypothetical protein
MARIRRFHQSYIVPTIALNQQLWTRLFWDRWDPLPLDEKLVWIFFVSNTIGIFTMIEFLFLK